MRDPGISEAAIARAARRGAMAVTLRPQIIADAVAATLDRWHDALLRQHVVHDWSAWAARVASNASKKLARKNSPRGGAARDATSADIAPQAARSEDDAEADESTRSRATLRRLLRAHLAQRRNLLRGRQLEVVSKLAKPGMSFHQAAKELGMPRFNVKRAFRSALRRLLRQVK